MLRPLLPLVLLSGCASWIEGEPACRFNVYDWSDDLLSHIMSGEGDGGFDYDPADTPRQNVFGDYNVNNGDYYWDVEYAASYFLDSANVVGYGTAYHNGDLDTLHEVNVGDVLGDIYNYWERTKREGCAMTIATGSDEELTDAFVISGTYTGDSRFEWSADVSGYTYQGSWAGNLSRTETIEADDGSYASQITTKPEGTAEGDITFTSSGYDYAGSYLRRFDGGEEQVLTMTEGGQNVGTVTTNYNYDGSGTVNYRYADGSTCDLAVEADGSCSYECSDGSSGTDC